MKRVFTLLTTVMFLSASFLQKTVTAQTPDRMSYQVVIRSSSNQLLTNTQIGMQISILQGTVDGITVYSETHTPVTNVNGLVSIEIGGGDVVSGDLATIDWGDGPYFIKTETDPAGGTSYTISAISRLLSVPYAFHSKTAESFAGTINETDPVYSAWDKSSGISITESQISDLSSYIETETDPGLAANFDLTNAGKGRILRYDGNKFVISSDTDIFSTEEIAGLTPEAGYAVFNRTENIYQIYTGTGWVAIPVNCWPEPSLADAGEDQLVKDIKTAVLAANDPDAGHGTGQWSVESGTGGSFENMYDPHTTFTWEEFGSYTLLWTITTTCGSSHDEVIITSQPGSYSHTISIDGMNDFTVADEMFQTSSMGYNGYITWDNDYLYLGYKGPDIANSNPAIYLNIYLGGTPGTTTGRMMNTQQPVLSFSAGHNIIWNTSNSVFQSYSFDGSSWITSSLVTPSDISRSSDFVEMRIPLASIGSPDKLKVHLNMLNATPGNEWSWGAVPSASFVDGYDPDYTKYFEFNLKDNVKPNQYTPLP